MTHFKRRGLRDDLFEKLRNRRHALALTNGFYMPTTGEGASAPSAWLYESK